MTKVIAIRPEPGLSATLALGRELGLDVIGAPLFEIRTMDWACPDPDRIDALLVGSANAFGGDGKELTQLVEKQVFAVGERTAKAARDRGFGVAATGSGGLQKVLDTIAPPKRLLRIAGADHVPLMPPEGVTIETVIAYESAPLQLDPAVVDPLSNDPIVLLHSARAAEHFSNECKRLNIKPHTVTLIAIGPRVIEDLDEEWRAIHVSSRPTDRDMLEMARKLCL